MSTLAEIKTAIEQLSPHDRALLAAELFAMEITPDESELNAALERGLNDVSAKRVRPVESVKAMIPGMDFKVLITDNAIADLKEIVEFVARDDPAAATLLAEKLINHALSLNTMTARFPLYEKRRNIRKMTMPPYLIFYQCDEAKSVVYILHIWHGARNYPSF